MDWKAWSYIGFTVLLVSVLAGIMIYYFKAKRRDRVESPKYRMLNDEE